MTLDSAYEFLNFWINKFTGSYYTPEQLDLIVDRGQMSLYADLQPKYATSQRIKDALSPFRSSMDFTTGTTPNGLITISSNLNCLSILDVMVDYTISGTPKRYVPVAIINEDERAEALRSQIDPPTVYDPIAEQIGSGLLQLWPKEPNSGTVTFLRRPVAPVYGYSVVSGRVIVYDPLTSTQLEWHEQWVNSLLLKALSSVGINLTESDISGYAQQKTTENFQNFNRT